MEKEKILNYLKKAKEKYQKEGLIIKALFGSYARNEAHSKSDIDILIEVTPKFANKYGFKSFSRLRDIQMEISKELDGIPVDFADSSGMGKAAKKFILDKAIYV